MRSIGRGQPHNEELKRDTQLKNRFKPRVQKGKQMAESILKLKKRAVAAGMPKSDAMKADREALNDFIEGASETKPKKKTVAKKKTGTKTETSRKKSTRKPARKTAATASKPKVKKPAKVKASENGDSGRLNIESSIDWTAEADDWNPRKGGPVERLFKALKASKGNIDKAYDRISDDPYAFVGKKNRKGEKRTKAQVEAMLRYRLNRTKWEFATRTGQHESADPKNRATYGTGQYATVRKVKPPRKNAAKKTGSKTKTSAKKTAARKRGQAKKPGRKRTKK